MRRSPVARAVALFRRIKKYYAVRRYVRRLGPELVRRYGKKRYYTPDDVLAVVDQGGYSQADIPYAYSIFCSREDFIEHYEQVGERHDFDAMRAEIAENHFEGNTNFEPATVIRHAESIGTHSPAGSHGHAANHHEAGSSHHSAGHQETGTHHQTSGHHDSGGHHQHGAPHQDFGTHHHDTGGHDHSGGAQDFGGHHHG